MASREKEDTAPVESQVDGVHTLTTSVWPGNQSTTDSIAEETPVALVYNGISYAVMMASPLELELLAVGFSLTEGIIDHTEDIYAIEQQRVDEGIELQISISSQCFMRFKNKRRSLTGRTGCGICGVESLRQLRSKQATVSADYTIAHSAVEHATRKLVNHQPLKGLTGAVHAAAWSDAEGTILAACEDIGRHNALDKLIGLLWPKQVFKQPGFLLISSRVSYEIIQKAAMANIAVVVAASAPTSLAIDVANDSDISLIGFSREQRHVVYTGPKRLTAG